MTTTKDNDTLSEIRDEYKLKKKQLNKYDTFLDRHQAFIVFMPLLLALIGLLVIVGITSGSSADSGSNVAARIVGIVSLVLLFAGAVMAFVTGGRKFAKGKIEKQLADLKNEAIAFQKHAKEHGNVTRDELGVWRDIKQDNSTKSNHKTVGVSVILTVLAVLSAPFIINQITNRDNTNKQATIQQNSQLGSLCLGDDRHHCAIDSRIFLAIFRQQYRSICRFHLPLVL